MLGDFFLGEGLLGADPDIATGGGNGYGNTANMLGQFMLGEPMLGADPSNGSGTGAPVVGPSGNVYQLTSSAIACRTTVTGTLREAITLLPTGHLNQFRSGNAGPIVIDYSAPAGTRYGQFQFHRTGLNNAGGMSNQAYTYVVQDDLGNTIASGTLANPSLSASAPDVVNFAAGAGRHWATIYFQDYYYYQPVQSGHYDYYYWDAATYAAQGSTAVVASLTQSSLRAQTSAGRTTVTGRLNEALTPTGAIQTGTTVRGNLTRVQTLAASNISCGTSVAGSLTRSVFRGSNIFCSTNVSASLALRELIRPEAVRAGTTPHGTLGIARAFTTTQNITCRTTVLADLTYATRLSGGSAVCGTVVTVTHLDRSNFYGQPIVCGTAVTGSNLYVASKYFGVIHAGTTVRVVEGGFKRILAGLQAADVQTVHAGTSVKGRVYVVPEDFVPVYLNTQTSLVVTLRLSFHFSATVTDHTAVTGGGLFGRVTMITKTVACKTTVKGGARYGNGGAINGFGFLTAALGVAFQLKKAILNGIFCHTHVTAATPKNGTAGHAWGGTRFALTYGRPDGELGFYVNDSNNWHYEGYNYVAYYQTHFPTLTIVIGLSGQTSVGRTQFRSLIVPSRAYAHDNKGPAPFYGPFGYVNMNRVPKGDLGLGDFIDAQTLVTASVLALRHRILKVLSVVGLEVPGSFTFAGDAVRGSGTRNVTGGTATKKIEADRAPVAQNAYYV